MMWCRDVHKILKLKSNIQEKLVEFERKCFKLSSSGNKLILYNYLVPIKINYYYRT
jgi:hypothetical protein